MIELTDKQLQSLADTRGSPARAVNPRTNETFVLLRVEEYERLRVDAYDDGPWTAEERHALAWEAGRHAGWDDMDEYDSLPEKP